MDDWGRKTARKRYADGGGVTDEMRKVGYRDLSNALHRNEVFRGRNPGKKSIPDIQGEVAQGISDTISDTVRGSGRK